MKVLFVTHYSELYGANLSMCNVAETLKNKYNVEVVVLCLSENKNDLKQYLDILGIETAFLKFYNTVYRKNSLCGIFKACFNCKRNLKLLSRLDTFFKENKFSLIHTNTMATFVGAQLARKYRIPHIWHLREFMEEDYGLCQIKNREFKEALNYTSRFIAISDSIKQKYLPFVKKNKIVRIYNGIPSIESREKNICNKKVIFSLVGVIRESKGTLEAISAFVKLVDSGYQNTELWIIGGGMEQKKSPYIKKINKMVNSFSYSEKIKFLGYRKDVMQLLDYVDVGLICSKLEAFGRITIEYMMKRVYVIGADSGGTAELIQDDLTGALYEAGNIAALKEKMSDYMLYRKEKQRIVDNAYKYSQDFTIDNCVDNIYKEYEKILNERDN